MITKFYPVSDDNQPHTIAASSRLHRVIQYCTKVRKTSPTGKESNNSATVFKVESPDFTWTSVPICSTATSDITPSATSGRHLSKFEKTTGNAASGGFESNFSGVAFCLLYVFFILGEVIE